jgi:hypothetical protein
MCRCNHHFRYLEIAVDSCILAHFLFRPPKVSELSEDHPGALSLRIGPDYYTEEKQLDSLSLPESVVLHVTDGCMKRGARRPVDGKAAHRS